MEVVVAAVAWALSAVCGSFPPSNTLGLCGGKPIESLLRGKLSAGAQIYLSGSDGYAKATNRWSVLDAPTTNIVVVPSVANDVSEIVKVANSMNVPYLAVNGGHGAITTVGKMKGGIEIWMDSLNSVKLSKDGKTATFGGGILSKAVTDSLWTLGKQTVTGGCECTSLLGPGLGGGHGFMQGRHGLIADQFVSMDIVLASGKLQTFNASSDLWWALQGAGHNFGIVTAVTSKVYDIEHPDWAYVSFLYTGDKVEALYRSINKYLLQDGAQPVHIINYSFFFNDPSLDPHKPVIMFYILQEGASAVDTVYTQPFIDIGPLMTNAAGGSYKDLPEWTGNANDSPPCQKSGLVNIRFPIDLQVYNVQAQRKVYDLFASATQETPALNGSLFLFEGYSTQGVKKVPHRSTAYPNRPANLLVAPLLTYPPGGKKLDRTAAKLGESLRTILYEASGLKEKYTYVNYAFGDETKQNWYGYESWRQDRLKALKHKYDPLGKFSYYAPIA
ncbi:FAD binding domain protein [Xylaria bambusicola]|uniref:FAD binding domain protein n=1 Tax=Xylaria bambusicola TaxID=326684 RepID=UPI002007C501|nr:FAD binding domain protein [Xylaria bambusicola]KAI0521823.1 FAD binding domain protein [Xylaria bambusicola]